LGVRVVVISDWFCPIRGTSSRIIVRSVTVGPLVGPVIVVAPRKVIPFVKFNLDVHVAVPAGTITVSPSTAAAMAVATSPHDTLAALMVAAFAWLETIESRLSTSAVP
jgi:hypothetical protein